MGYQGWWIGLGALARKQLNSTSVRLIYLLHKNKTAYQKDYENKERAQLLVADTL
jgi:hypothetical protein